MGIVGRLDQYASMLAGEFDDYSMSENLLTYSEQFTVSWSTGNGTISSNLISAPNGPNGLLTADAFIENTTPTSFHFVNQTLSKSASSIQYSGSCWVKDNGRQVLMNIQSNGSNGVVCRFNPTTGQMIVSPTAFGTGWTAGSFSVVPYPNGWYRVSMTATSDTLTTVVFQLATHNGTTNTYTGDGVSGIYIWGAQLEVGSTATDYTPTTTTAISRVLPSTTNTNITGLSTYFSSGFSENVGAATTLVANVFPPYDLVYDDFGGTLFGAGQGRYMRQNTDKSVIVYNEIDEVTDFYSRGVVRAGLVLDLDAGLTSSYPGTGATWTDLGVNGLNATLVNSPTYSSSNQGYLSFASASSQYATATNPGSLSRWTVETVVRFTAAYNTKVAMVVGGQYNGASSLNFTIGTNNAPTNYNIAVGFFDGAWRSTTGILYPQNTWVHITGTYDGSTIRQFTNGNQVDSLNYVGTPTSGGEIRINRRWDDIVSSGNLFDSNIAMVRIYNRALTAAEIKQNYDATKGRFGL